MDGYHRWMLDGCHMDGHTWAPQTDVSFTHWTQIVWWSLGHRAGASATLLPHFSISRKIGCRFLQISFSNIWTCMCLFFIETWQLNNWKILVRSLYLKHGATKEANVPFGEEEWFRWRHGTSSEQFDWVCFSELRSGLNGWSCILCVCRVWCFV